MTKPNKLFSWLGFGKKDPAPVTPEAVADTKPEASPATPASAVIQAETASAEPTTAVTAEPPVVTDNPATPALEATQAAAVAAEVLVTPVAVPEVIVAADSAAVIEIEVTPPAIAEPEPVIAAATVAPASSDNPKKPGFFARLKQGLAKTSQNLGAGLASLFLGKKIDDELYEELETQLLLADVGVETTQKLIKQLVADANRRQLKDAEVLYEKLQDEMALLLDKVEQPLQIDSSSGPYVILMVGVNGVGKTTTIGKLAQQIKQQGKSVMLAAGDTFRAAAVEQLQVWGERNEIPVIAQHSGADSASVIFDAYQAAKARKVDVLIADTAGRLQNKAHLMEELKKIVRVMKKIDGAAPHEVMLTLDAGTGQNALSQAKLFHEAVQLTGITLTKLDGTAKGGVIFAIADQFSLPIRYIGVGEGIDDLRVFQSRDFIRALFNREF
jgi:fused signal recognition particle receptor